MKIIISPVMKKAMFNDGVIKGSVEMFVVDNIFDPSS
jgi:hypothetical protein